MSQLSKSLEKRIQELTASIEAQKTELAAYERVLHMELTKGSAPAETTSDAHEAPTEVSHPTKKTRAKAAPAEKETEAPAADLSGVSFTGNKTNLVAEIVKSHGSEGATPKDVDAFFTTRNIKRSKNLIYNTLSYLVAHKRLYRKDGKYFIVGGTEAAPSTSAAAATPAVKKTKRRLSPEGLKRIREALKKRWAAKKAAEGVSAKPAKATKKAAKKK